MPANLSVSLQTLGAKSLHKAFGDNQVLTDINLTIRSGEVHALLGENGAGKSTLVKILAGFEQPSAGHLVLETPDQSRQLSGWNAREAESEGVVLIHQELNLGEQLTVAENVFLGQELRAGLFLDKRAMLEKTREFLQQLHCDVQPHARVGELSVAAKQMVEIARTRAKEARVLIMDEPTAVLTSKESEALYELIQRLCADGVAVVFISHKLEEIERIADRISILRDGRLVGTFAASELSKDDMVRHMVGREINELFPKPKRPNADASVALEATNILVRGTHDPCSFALRRGEILGFAGLVGSGRTALLETVLGIRSAAAQSSGHIAVAGQTVKIGNLAHARSLGLAYLTKDRKGSGLLLDKGLVFNFSLYALAKFSRIVIDTRAEQAAYRAAVDTFDIRAGSESMAAGKLSGGNQQKLLLAKMLEARPGVIVIDEPTRGIDIGTKSQIYHFIANLAEAGHSIVVISSDLIEVIGLCHRVAVMFHGQLTALLEGDEINEEQIMAHATGLKRPQSNIAASSEEQSRA